MDDHEIKSCPFCGSQAKLQIDECLYSVGPTYYFVACIECWSRTHKRSDLSETLAYWNERLK